MAVRAEGRSTDLGAAFVVVSSGTGDARGSGESSREAVMRSGPFCRGRGRGGGTLPRRREWARVVAAMTGAGRLREVGEGAGRRGQAVSG